MDKIAYQEIHRQLQFKKMDVFAQRHIAGDLVLLLFAGFGARWTSTYAGTACAAVLLGIFMFRGFSLMHEAVHGIAHSRKTVNDRLGHIFGVFCFLPFSQWRQIHLDHHLWAGNFDRDPTMRILKQFRETGVAPSPSLEFAWRWCLPYVAFRQQVVFWRRSCAAISASGGPANRLVLSELIGVTAFIAMGIVAFGPWCFLGAILVYLELVEWINLPHHLDLKQSGGDRKLSPLEQDSIARSIAYPAWFSRFVLLNFNYHVEHHLFPTLPWYQLDHAHRLVKRELKSKLNLQNGNAWHRQARKLRFQQILERSTEELPLKETKLVS